MEITLTLSIMKTKKRTDYDKEHIKKRQEMISKMPSITLDEALAQLKRTSK